MTESLRDQAVMMMGCIRYQVFTPEVTTMGACPRCGEGSRGAGVCAACVGKDLDALLTSDMGRRYVRACVILRSAENVTLAMAEGLDDPIMAPRAVEAAADRGQGGEGS